MSPRIPIVDLAAEYEEVGPEIEEAVLRVLRSGRYVLGPETQAFESELAAYVGTRHAVGVGSGTEALWLALRACGVGSGDEVITSPLSFFATAEAIALTGATPVYVDVEPGGFNLDPAGLDKARTPRTRAIVPVHLFGRCADMARIQEFAECHALSVVEDAAQAIGAGRGGRRAGTWGRAGCFSFYPSKSLGAAGDAGCVTTDDDALADALRSLRNHGAGPGGHVRIGTTSRLDSLQAAVLRVKLPYLARWNEARRAHAARYRELLAGAPLELPAAHGRGAHAYHQFTVRIAAHRRDAAKKALADAGVSSGVYYPIPLHRQPVYASAFAGLALPESEAAAHEVLSLPIYPQLTDEQIRHVAATLRACL